MRKLQNIQIEISGWDFRDDIPEGSEYTLSDSATNISEQLLRKVLNRRISVMDMMKFEEFLENFDNN